MAHSALRDDLVVYFQNVGYEVVASSNNANIIKQIKSKSFDCLILQLSTYDLSGLELILNMKNMEFDIPIIAIGFKNPEIQKITLQAGASHFVQYPVHPEILLKLIQTTQK